MQRSFCLLAFLTTTALAAAQDGEASTSPSETPSEEEAFLIRDVTFTAGEVESQSYLALPKGEGPFPGILILPEWWGLNDTMKMRARMLAELGYAALAVDLYGGGKIAHDPPTAASYQALLMARRSESRARFLAAMEFLRLRPEVDKEKIGAIGYGSGADLGLQMARNGTVGLDAMAAFHPFFKVRAPNPPIDKIPAKILVCNAGEDPYVKLAAVARFKELMKDCQADMQFVDFPTAMQSFTIPNASWTGEKFGIPHVYSREDDLASWKVLEKFLADLWPGETPADEGAPSGEPASPSSEE